MRKRDRTRIIRQIILDGFSKARKRFMEFNAQEYKGYVTAIVLDDMDKDRILPDVEEIHKEILDEVKKLFKEGKI